MISRAILFMGRRKIQYLMGFETSSSPLPLLDSQAKVIFSKLFGERQEKFFSDFKDQKGSGNEKERELRVEKIKEPAAEKVQDPIAEKNSDPCPEKEKDPCLEQKIDPCAEKTKDPCLEKMDPCSEKSRINLCKGGSSGPPKGPEEQNLLKRPEFPGKVRLGFIPEEWFQFFYPKTGVTGPYMFGIGLLTYLSSKEIYIMEHEYYTGLSLAILMAVLVNKLGPPTAVYADKQIDKHELDWANMHKSDIEKLQKDIENEKKEQWRADGALMLIEAKRQMIDMQLEAAYREEIMKVYNEVIQRLDFQVESASVEHRFNHKHMMFWLHDQVSKAIKDEQVNDAEREKRKADLSAMVVRIKDYETAANIRAGSSFNKPS